MLGMLLVIAVLLGLAVGSFLNVVVYRVPAGLSIIRPESRCPGCERPIRARHNVPLLGWLILRGRCADCHAPISVRYPLVELATAVLFALVIWFTWSGGALALAPTLLYLGAVGIALALIDIDVHRLPNVIVLPSYPVVAALLTAASAWTGDWAALARAGLAALTLFCFYLVLVLVYPAGMGWGDVKLAGVLGAVLGYVGWPSLIVGAFAGFLLGSVIAVVVMITGRGGRKTALPFGPFMLLGTAIGLVAGHTIGRAYLGLVGI